MIRSLIKKKFPASRLAMAIGFSGSLLAVNAAVAQDATASAEPDRVVITGSNIPTAEEVGTARVDTVDQAARDRTGQQDVLSVLQKADPSFSGGGNLGQSNASIASGTTYGGSAVSIHGLPTLVLLNGRRVADSAAQAAGGAAFVDVNLFPTALVKRIEVLKDGASAIYGSEAIGGVVNVILDQDFRGFQIDGRYGFTEKSDVKDKRVSGIVGLGDDKTSIVIGAQYIEQDPIFNRDRDWAGPSFGTNSFNGNIRLATAANWYVLKPGISSPIQVTGLGTVANAAGLAASGAYNGPIGTSADASIFDLSKGTGITLDQSRLSVFGQFTREILPDYLSVYGEFLYSRNYTQSYLNAQPITGASTDAAGNGLIVPPGGTVPANSTTGLPVLSPFNFTITPANATGAGRVDIRARFIDFPRIFRSDTDFYRFVGGVRGTLLKSIELAYDVSFNTSQNEINYRNSNLPIVANLNQAIANGQLDIFSTANQDAAISAAGIEGTNFRDLKSALNVFDAGITVFPFKLPAGPIGLALGYEYRFEKFRYDDSPEIFLGSVPVPGINTGRDIHAAYAELQIPVISPTMKIPGVYQLDLDGAVRMEKYEGINSSFVPKASFVYRPIQDVALRGSFSKSFIAPTLLQTNGPTSSGFSESIAIGNFAPEQAFEQGGSNPNLSPSTADTYAVGIVISPKQVPGLTISGDFFHVEQKNIVGVIPDVTIANSVNTLGPASPFASLIRLGGFNGTVVTAPNQIGGNLGDYYITDNLVNIGRVRLGGVDFGVNYTHDFDNGGPARFGIATAGINGVYYLQYKQENLPGDPAYDTIGYYIGRANEVPQYKLAPYVEYRWGGFKASALGNYTPSVRDAHDIDLSTYTGPRQGYLPKIRDYYTIDLLFAYTFGLNKPAPAVEPAPAPKDGKDGGKQVVSKDEVRKMSPRFNLLDGLSLSFGINNVTNARPPLINNSPDSTNTDAALYDPYQRLYYFTVTKKF